MSGWLPKPAPVRHRDRTEVRYLLSREKYDRCLPVVGEACR